MKIYHLLNTYIVSTKIFVETRERLIQPQVAPPETSDQITEPFVGQLVRHDSGDENLIDYICVVLII